MITRMSSLLLLYYLAQFWPFESFKQIEMIGPARPSNRHTTAAAARTAHSCSYSHPGEYNCNVTVLVHFFCNIAKSEDDYAVIIKREISALI